MLAANCLDALSGSTGSLGLQPVLHVIAVIVDGLGASNLGERAGHARFLAAHRRRPLIAPVPSTTAAALTTAMTGALPGQHGLVGYEVLDPGRDRLVNQLRGWDSLENADTWQRCATAFEDASRLSIRPFAVGPSKFAGSGFTQAVLRGSQYVPADSISERVDAAIRLSRQPEPTFVYLYIPELDKLAHKHGWQSDRWVTALEDVDAELARLHEEAPPRTGVVVSADHGILDISGEAQILYDQEPSLLNGVRHVGGEPRFRQLYVEPGESVDAVAERWRAVESERAWVATKEEAVSAGWFGEVDADVSQRIGDVLIAARKRVTYYDSTPASAQSRRMIGQHGSLTDEEMLVPFIPVGAWA